MRNLKVLHLLDTLNRGGAEIMELDLCRNAQRCGLDLMVVATNDGDLKEEFRQSGIEVIFLKRRFPLDPFIIWKLRKILKKNRIDIIHSHQAMDGLHAYFGTAGSKTKQVLSFHGYTKALKKLLALKFLVPRMDANIVVSRHFLHGLLSKEGYDSQSNFSVVENGVAADKLMHTGNRSLRSELGLTDDCQLLGMVGNFVREKDQITLCRAMPALLREFPKLHLVLVGGTFPGLETLKDECEKYCHEQEIVHAVHFLGKRNNIAEVLSSLDLFVLSSKEETFGIAAVESMMAGIATILSDIPAFREISRDGCYSHLFKTGDFEALANAVSRLLRDKGERDRLKFEGKQWALENYSIDRHIHRLKELYSQVAQCAA